jgi:hypothetical protein
MRKAHLRKSKYFNAWKPVPTLWRNTTRDGSTCRQHRRTEMWERVFRGRCPTRHYTETRKRMCGVGRGVGESTRRSASRLLWPHHIWMKWLSKRNKMKLKYAFHFLIAQIVIKEQVHPQYELLSNSVSGNRNLIVFSVLIMSSIDARSRPTHCVYFLAYFSYFEMSNDRGHTYRHRHWLERFMKYAVEMGAGATIYTPSFIKTGSVIQKLMGCDTQTHTAWRSHTPILIFST